jgi:site-specific recombinase XerD
MTNFSPVIVSWIDWLSSTDAPRRLSAPTLSAYKRHLTSFATWLNDSLQISLSHETTTAYRMEAYLSYLRDELQRRPATQAQAIAALSSFGLWLVETKQLGINPARRLKAQPEQASPPKSLDAVVVKRMLDAAHHTGDLRDALIIELLAFSGMRASEVAGLQIEQLERGQRSTWIRIEGKGRKIRRIPLPKRVSIVIDSYLAQRSAKEGARPSTGPLIVGIRGPITRLTINTTVARLAERAAISPEQRAAITPHAFRHTVATQVVRQHDIVIAADLLGHASLNTTRRYAKATENELEEAIENLYVAVKQLTKTTKE